MKFKLFGYNWDLTVPAMFLYTSFAFGWVFLPKSFDANTPAWAYVGWAVVMLMILAIATVKKAEPEDV